MSVVSEHYRLARPVYFSDFTPPSSVEVNGRQINLKVTRAYLCSFTVSRGWLFGAVSIQAEIDHDANVRRGIITYPVSNGWIREYVSGFKRELCNMNEPQKIDEPLTSLSQSFP